jgi:hypothetical protein
MLPGRVAIAGGPGLRRTQAQVDPGSQRCCSVYVGANYEDAGVGIARSGAIERPEGFR